MGMYRNNFSRFFWVLEELRCGEDFNAQLAELAI
jgi:hypothetical protein